MTAATEGAGLAECIALECEHDTDSYPSGPGESWVCKCGRRFVSFHVNSNPHTPAAALRMLKGRETWGWRSEAVA